MDTEKKEEQANKEAAELIYKLFGYAPSGYMLASVKVDEEDPRMSVIFNMRGVDVYVVFSRILKDHPSLVPVFEDILNRGLQNKIFFKMVLAYIAGMSVATLSMLLSATISVI